ncbi:MAG: ABC transporter ATP-binding protein [Puniceicoccales bacterium]|jgi:iron(III) transport system ATP-binding protein|nr:ABC transporter ATP-binding protein [Puniceicoccales bacterium]
MVEIRIRKLLKRFQDVLALDHIGLSIHSGELFFLLGPSGCGKTTLLRSIAGFCLPDGGRICFGERDVTRLLPHKRGTGMVFQSYALWPHMTVAQNVAFGLEQQKLPRDEVEKKTGEALEIVQMKDYARRRPNELSGGQQQRVALARALVVRPNCLLLDEPLSNLDAQLRNEMRVEIRKICKENGLTTIYVTHDQKEALSIADRIAVLSKGKVEQVGTPMELYRRPKNTFVANFIGETNLLEGVVLRSHAEGIMVRTQVGSFSGVLSNRDRVPTAGTKIQVSIRPEVLRLDLYPSEDNCIEGHIETATYFGEIAHYQFEKNGISLKISELNPQHFESFQQKMVYAYASPEDVVILSD